MTIKYFDRPARSPGFSPFVASKFLGAPSEFTLAIKPKLLAGNRKTRPVPAFISC
jgi:hypothetical protein